MKPTFPSKILALRISELLESQQITRYELCKRGFLAESTLTNIMSETHKTVTLNTIIKIAYGFGMTLEQFFKSPLFDFENFNIF